MVFFNYATMQMAAKIVYYGPGLCGKTTNLHHIYGRTAPDSRGEMVSLETETDRTLFFDLLPLDVGVISGFKTRVQLYTVPGQVFYNTTRKLVLKGVDGIVFVADSQRAMKEANRRDVAARDGTRERLFEGEPADRFDGRCGQFRERDPPLLFLETGVGPGVRRQRQKGRRPARRQGRSEVVKGFARRRNPMRARADPAADRLGRVLRGRLAFDRDERVPPVVLRQTRERPERMERPRRRAGVGERREHARGKGAREVERETPAAPRREPGREPSERVVGRGEDEHVGVQRFATFEVPQVDARKILRGLARPHGVPGRENETASRGRPRSRKCPPGAPGPDENHRRFREIFRHGRTLLGLLRVQAPSGPVPATCSDLSPRLSSCRSSTARRRCPPMRRPGIQPR